MTKRSTTTVLLVGLVLGASLGVPASIAAGKLTGHDIRNDSLTGKDVRDGSLKSGEFSQTYTWRVTVSSNGQSLSGNSIPAGSIIVPVRAEFTSQFCGGAPVNNPQVAAFQIYMVGGYAQTLLVNHPVDLLPRATGPTPARLSISLPACGGQVQSANLEFTFEVRAGGQGTAKAFG